MNSIDKLIESVPNSDLSTQFELIEKAWELTSFVDRIEGAQKKHVSDLII